MGDAPARFGKDAIDDLLRRMNEVERRIRLGKDNAPYLPMRDYVVQGTPFPQDGAIMLDYRGNPLDGELTSVIKYGYGGEWNPVNGAEFHIKLFRDNQVSTLTALDPSGQPRFSFLIPQKLNGFKLVRAVAYNSSIASAQTQVSLQNWSTSFYMLTTNMTIPAGANVSPGGEGVIDPAHAQVQWNQQVAVFIEEAPGDDAGLGCVLEFSI